MLVAEGRGGEMREKAKNLEQDLAQQTLDVS